MCVKKKKQKSKRVSGSFFEKLQTDFAIKCKIHFRVKNTNINSKNKKKYILKYVKKNFKIRRFFF